MLFLIYSSVTRPLFHMILGATIPKHRALAGAYSAVLPTRVSSAHDFPAIRLKGAFSLIAGKNPSCAAPVKSCTRHIAAGSEQPERWLRLTRTSGSVEPEYSFRQNYLLARNSSSCFCFSAMISSIPAAFSSSMYFGRFSAGSIEPHIRAVL